MTLEELRSRYRTQILEIAEKRGARNVRVFGSIARGEQRSSSDIDILVDFQPGRSLLDLTGLWLDLEEALGSKVDVVSSRGLKPRVEREIMRDAIAL
jgi:uncharacterized protein